MKYDFETLVSRKGTGSSKWDGMYTKNPNTPDNIVPFSVADMELKNPPEVMTALKEYLDGAILGYTGATDKYYDAVCGWMKRRHNWDIDKDWIVTTPGCVPAFVNCVKTFAAEGEGVIIMTPIYYPFYLAMQLHNREIVRNPLIFKDNKYEIDFADLEAKAKDPNNKVLLFCSPHNPVGRVWTREELERIGKICLDNDVLIVSDEIHFDLILPGYKHTVFATLSDELADNMITCTAPSKTFNLAGMQTSNIIIKNPELREKFKFSFLQQAHTSLNALGYIACQTAYNECEGWLDELIVHLDENKKLLTEFISKNLPQIKVIELEGTYLQWLDCRELGMTHEELEKFMVEKAYWFLDEGYIFGEEGVGFERINIACPKSVLQDALDRLLAAVKSLG